MQRTCTVVAQHACSRRDDETTSDTWSVPAHSHSHIPTQHDISHSHTTSISFSVSVVTQSMQTEQDDKTYFTTDDKRDGPFDDVIKSERF